ncbi:MAG TPA: ABC transporter permease [Micromonosporaceae bacterium]
MAVGVTAPAEPADVRPVTAAHFIRLKLRMMANGFRGQTWRVVLYVLGALTGLWLAGLGFLLFAAGGFTRDPEIALLTAAFGGAMLVFGWLVVPLAFFGVDETLDPARFALLPLPRRTLVTGLLSAALIGVPAAATLLATGGLVLSAAVLGGWLAALGAAVGVVAGLLLCVAASRALTSALATMLRSRRSRDLAAVLVAAVAGLLGPLQIAGINLLERADWHRLTGVAEVLGWSPLAAPYTVGLDITAGRFAAALVKLLLTGAAIAALLLWWSRSLESAMLGSAEGATKRRRGAASGPVEQLFPQVLFWLPRNRYGALVARVTRYWWRETRQRAGLVTFVAISVFLPVMVGVRGVAGAGESDSGLVIASLSVVFIGTLGAISTANQFGYDGSAYAANIIAAVPGKTELRARMAAISIYLVPLLVGVAVLVGLLSGKPGWIPALAGSLLAAYGSGLAASLYVSVLGAYPLPESSNPFAVNTGAGVAKGLLSLVALVGGGAATVPIIVATALLADAWLWLALPVGVGYGAAAAILGSYLAGDVLDRRMPEVLAAITPRR